LHPANPNNPWIFPETPPAAGRRRESAGAGVPDSTDLTSARDSWGSARRLAPAGAPAPARWPTCTRSFQNCKHCPTHCGRQRAPKRLMRGPRHNAQAPSVSGVKWVRPCCCCCCCCAHTMCCEMMHMVHCRRVQMSGVVTQHAPRRATSQSAISCANRLPKELKSSAGDDINPMRAARAPDRHPFGDPRDLCREICHCHKYLQQDVHHYNRSSPKAKPSLS
jgi:hypothetical protein